MGAQLVRKPGEGLVLEPPDAFRLAPAASRGFQFVAPLVGRRASRVARFVAVPLRFEFRTQRRHPGE